MKRILLIILPILFFITAFGQTPQVGEKAPEIVLKDTTGNEVKLSDLKGKMVLIDFWASWCKPCRKENPYLVAAYNKYKDARFESGEGFEIFSVSLDSKMQRWQNAIIMDKLPWPYHVSDLKGWRNKAAQDYSIRSVPSNFLIDGEGNIVAVNLRGHKLEDVLKEYKVWKLWK